MRIDIDDVIEESGIQYPPDMYIKRAFRVSIYTLIIAIFSILYFINPIFIIFIPLSILAFSLTFLSFILYPYLIRRIESDRVSRSLIDIYGILYSLSSTGNIDYIFTILSESMDKYASKPFRRYLYNRSILGLNVLDALRRASERCPNPELKNVFSLLADSISKSGDIRMILKHLFEKGLIERRGSLEKAVRSSMLIGEFYITLVILLPIIMMIIFVVFSIVGGNLLGINPIILIPVTVYLTPVISLMFYILSGD